jgi:hypothetical protein
MNGNHLLKKKKMRNNNNTTDSNNNCEKNKDVDFIENNKQALYNVKKCEENQIKTTVLEYEMPKDCFKIKDKEKIISACKSENNISLSDDIIDLPYTIPHNINEILNTIKIYDNKQINFENEEVFLNFKNKFNEIINHLLNNSLISIDFDNGNKLRDTFDQYFSNESIKIDYNKIVNKTIIDFNNLKNCKFNFWPAKKKYNINKFIIELKNSNNSNLKLINLKDNNYNENIWLDKLIWLFQDTPNFFTTNTNNDNTNYNLTSGNEVQIISNFENVNNNKKEAINSLNNNIVALKN